MIIPKRDLHNPQKNKELKKLITSIGFDAYGKFMTLYYTLKGMGVDRISRDNEENISEKTGISDLEIPLLLWNFENIFPPLIESDDTGALIFRMLKKRSKEENEELQAPILDGCMYLKLRREEHQKLSEELDPGELKVILEEVDEWLSVSKAARLRASHYLTIKTFLRNKQSKGLVYTGRGPQGPGYYPHFIVSKLNQDRQ